MDAPWFSRQLTRDGHWGCPGLYYYAQAARDSLCMCSFHSQKPPWFLLPSSGHVNAYVPQACQHALYQSLKCMPIWRMNQRHILISTCISLTASEKCLLVTCISSCVHFDQFFQWAVGLFLIILKETLTSSIRKINPLANVLQMFFPVSNITF